MCLERPPQRPRRRRGFTLIEVMIVVVMIAILGAVALPSYQASVRKGRRADARSVLVTTAQLMERYSTEHATTGYSTATLSTVAGPTVVAKPASDNGYYVLSLGNLAATTFTLQAAPQGAQSSDGCGTFTLDERGVRGVTGGTLTTTDCW
ncbi:MAG TPA: type IV pilin protein [Caldimonas sp.]|jgi:type IV pilus assembly protein PilE|nr:type IV pilin protein [Caldimonas sp.]HEX4235275.1 type IV pilin protein [Caldimonas sp.]